MKKKLHKRNALFNVLKQALGSMFLMLLFTANTTSNAQSVTIPVSHDAYVWGANPNNVYNNTVLVTKYAASGANNRYPYIKFDISNVIGTITSAKLRLFQRTTFVDARQIHAVADDTWDETTLTWNNKPAVGTEIASFTPVSADWVEIDVTTYVQGEYATDKIVSFAINMLSDSPNGIDFISKENTAPEHADHYAQLVIDGVTLGIEDKNISLETYPNPVLNELNISLANANLDLNSANIALYSITGAKVLELKPKNLVDIKMDLSKLNKGVYMLILSDKVNNSIAKKIVKL